MTFQVKAEILLANDNWEKNLRKSSKQLEGFGKSVKTISNSIKWAWAGVATLAFGAVGDAIVELTKAAAEDARSQRILGQVVANNVKGGKKYLESIEEQISAWQMMSAVQDDQIRPAYAYLIRATKSVTKSNKLMQISLDLAAGAHIDIQAAASAVGRAYNGNLIALNKLAPGIKKLKDPLGEVAKRFKGLAEIEGKNDPFMKINIVMDEFKEKLGASVLPLVQQFAEYMASPEFQKSLDDIVKKVSEFGTWFASPEGQEAFKGWMDDLKALIKLAGDFLNLVGEVQGVLDDKKKSKALTSALNTREGSAAFNWLGGGPTGKFAYTSAEALAKSGGNMAAIGGTPTINIKVNPITGDAIAELLRGTAKRRGIPVGKMIQ